MKKYLLILCCFVGSSFAETSLLRDFVEKEVDRSVENSFQNGQTYLHGQVAGVDSRHSIDAIKEICSYNILEGNNGIAPKYEKINKISFDQLSKANWNYILFDFTFRWIIEKMAKGYDSIKGFLEDVQVDVSKYVDPTNWAQLVDAALMMLPYAIKYAPADDKPFVVLKYFMENISKEERASCIRDVKIWGTDTGVFEVLDKARKDNSILESKGVSQTLNDEETFQKTAYRYDQFYIPTMRKKFGPSKFDQFQKTMAEIAKSQDIQEDVKRIIDCYDETITSEVLEQKIEDIYNSQDPDGSKEGLIENMEFLFGRVYGLKNFQETYNPLIENLKASFQQKNSKDCLTKVLQVVSDFKETLPETNAVNIVYLRLLSYVFAAARARIDEWLMDQLISIKNYSELKELTKEIIQKIASKLENFSFESNFCLNYKWEWFFEK